MNLKRENNDEKHEKDAVLKTNEDLRGKVKKVETDRISLKRANEEKAQRISVLEESKNGLLQEGQELRAGLREVERSRLEARRELQELRRQIKMIDAESEKKSAEVSDLQKRIASDESREEENRRENYGLKQRIVETEASRDTIVKDNNNKNRKIAELEETLRSIERELSNTVSDHRVVQGKLKDEIRATTQSLLSRDQENADLKIRLSDLAGRGNGLEAELSRNEQEKRDTEYKLGALYSALRRTLGISRMGRCASPCRGPNSRSPSPSRRNRSINNDSDQEINTTESGEKYIFIRVFSS
jgi:rootletin